MNMCKKGVRDHSFGDSLPRLFSTPNHLTLRVEYELACSVAVSNGWWCPGQCIIGMSVVGKDADTHVHAGNDAQKSREIVS